MVAVSRVTVMDSTGERVQLLQGYPKSHPHVVGHQVPAGHAGSSAPDTQHDAVKAASRRCRSDSLFRYSLIHLPKQHTFACPLWRLTS